MMRSALNVPMHAPTENLEQGCVVGAVIFCGSTEGAHRHVQLLGVWFPFIPCSIIIGRHELDALINRGGFLPITWTFGR